MTKSLQHLLKEVARTHAVFHDPSNPIEELRAAALTASTLADQFHSSSAEVRLTALLDKGLAQAGRSLIHSYGYWLLRDPATADSIHRLLMTISSCMGFVGTEALTPRCHSASCDEVPTALAHWPGKDVLFCSTCLLRARKIAEAMGISLTVSFLPEDS